ncbi:SDR family NAD(P)-dependent oxidoreductase [Ancylomarina euxinus]|uniref:SDR family NAD(P)-dependent oxidoreductase n=1 Tax=Ancylomarina euxinus TaxID=2283627 RepID=A0A425XYW4_9BACT|nr:SDR family NAD(P)-dependent oxidoreductase [Ancylomarina euxinus]MCZ4695548.1 SDR family NAD(P)-dependent oxidoreductase [Ancylomarina euxinus]MUP15929.1 SDR family NAD(P)-dependent oxidoreductase [Ancylomarina euxinus]RRG20370.1 SDR family NAD(P)-dependent oxidoreductase [Ancylomarina euxinus]
MKKVIIIGATSGIGKELAKLFMCNNYKVGLTGLHTNGIEELIQNHPEHLEIRYFDCTKESSSERISELVSLLGGLDLLIFSAGIGHLNGNPGFEVENRANKLNVMAFTEIADWSYRFFEKQGKGHFVTISSVAGLRGYRVAPAYHAAKSYQISYLEALKQKAYRSRKSIYITDIRPGFVETEMSAGKRQFWLVSKEKAAKQIYSLIKRKKGMGYISRRWQIVAIVMKLLPRWIHKRM